MAGIVPPPVFSARMVRELKGAPLSCLVLLMLAGMPVSNEWLCMMSGYTDKPVAQALKLLSSPEHQLVCRTSGGWRLSDAFQLALINRNFSDSTTATDLNLINLNTDKAVVVAGRNFSDSLENHENPHFAENLAMCKHLGIGEPKASQISDLFDRYGAPIEPDFIKAHIDSLGQGEAIGLAIVRILSDEFPRAWEEEIGQIPRPEEGEEVEFSVARSVAVETVGVE